MSKWLQQKPLCSCFFSEESRVFSFNPYSCAQQFSFRFFFGGRQCWKSCLMQVHGNHDKKPNKQSLVNKAEGQASNVHTRKWRKRQLPAFCFPLGPVVTQVTFESIQIQSLFAIGAGIKTTISAVRLPFPASVPAIDNAFPEYSIVGFLCL